MTGIVKRKSASFAACAEQSMTQAGAIMSRTGSVSTELFGKSLPVNQ